MGGGGGGEEMGGGRGREEMGRGGGGEEMGGVGEGRRWEGVGEERRWEGVGRDRRLRFLCCVVFASSASRVVGVTSGLLHSEPSSVCVQAYIAACALPSHLAIITPSTLYHHSITMPSRVSPHVPWQGA